MKEKKAQRDLRRKQGNLSAEEEQAMTKESQFMKAELRRLKKSLAEKTTLETEYEDYQNNISRLKQLRKQLSDALQQWLFAQFRMLNAEGEEKICWNIQRYCIGRPAEPVTPLQKSCTEDGSSCRKRRMLRTQTAPVCFQTSSETPADGDVLVGRKSERGNQTPPAVLSSLQW